MHRLARITGFLVALGCGTDADAQWVRNPATGHYYGPTSRTSWNGAEREARFLGGHLVTIEDQAENDWVLRQFGELAAEKDGGLWIGLAATAKKDGFAWSSGAPLGYKNWNVLQPDNFKGGEGFVHMWGPKALGLLVQPGKWNDHRDLPARASGGVGYVGIVEVDTLPSFTVFAGSGCSRSVPLPLPLPVSVSAGLTPAPGRTFRIRSSNLSPLALGTAVLGRAADPWHALPQPFDLGMTGMPGCNPLVSWSTGSAVLIGLSGMCEGKFVVPAVPALLGAALYVHGWGGR